MPEHPSTDEITRYLLAIQEGSSEAERRLLEVVYEELHDRASRLFRDQRNGHTLQPTVLVHDAYVRLVGPNAQAFENRQHFIRVAATAMRRLLIDYARKYRADKRGGTYERVALVDEMSKSTGDDNELDLVALDEALTELAKLHARQAKVVELRFLAGMSVEETAQALGVSERTVFLDWKMARFWLEQRLTEG